MNRNRLDGDGSGPTRDPIGRLHHDLRSAIGAASLTMETLQLLGADAPAAHPGQTEAMLQRALTSLRDAARIADELEAAGGPGE